MKPSNQNNSSKLRDSGKLSIEAILAITDLVEEIHTSLSLTKQKKGGISGFVYWLIRFITKAVGLGVDSLLRNLEHQFDGIPTEQFQGVSPSNQAVLSALNGVLGDYLFDRNSALAIPMQLEKVEKNSATIILWVHGLCMNANQWNRNNVDFRSVVHQNLGFSNWSLTYNTGRHISENGKELSFLLEKEFLNNPELETMSIVAHSMGGLVIRSAVFYADKLGHSWLKKLKKVIFLGTPHHGSPLEKAGNWFENLLTKTEYTKAFAKLGTVRSSGITDLRFGNLTDQDWMYNNRFKRAHDPRNPIPLVPSIAWYAVAGSITQTANQVGDFFPGDGLVPVKSAMGISTYDRYTLVFKPENTFIARGVGHFDLLCDEKIAEKVLMWLEEASV
ncbi:hypothetical protein EP331_14885 [bacterium]|nr:MAG: hypothetical protein EP331_14885 [bacterium]